MYHEYAWERDAIRAALHKERLEHELHPEDDLHLSPLRMSITGGLAFVVGAFVPLLSVLLVPDQAHTVVRTLAIGVVAMSLSMIGGTVID